LTTTRSGFCAAWTSVEGNQVTVVHPTVTLRMRSVALSQGPGNPAINTRILPPNLPGWACIPGGRAREKQRGPLWLACGAGRKDSSGGRSACVSNRSLGRRSLRQAAALRVRWGHTLLFQCGGAGHGAALRDASSKRPHRRTGVRSRASASMPGSGAFRPAW